MAYQKLTQKKIDAILVDVKAGVGVIMLQAKHKTSLATMYSIPGIRKFLYGRSRRAREKQIKDTVALARKVMPQREIAHKLGISVVTVRQHMRRAEKQGLITLAERMELGKAAKRKMLKGLWGHKRKYDDELEKRWDSR